MWVGIHVINVSGGANIHRPLKDGEGELKHRAHPILMADKLCACSYVLGERRYIRCTMAPSLVVGLLLRIKSCPSAADQSPHVRITYRRV